MAYRARGVAKLHIYTCRDGIDSQPLLREGCGYVRKLKLYAPAHYKVHLASSLILDT